MARCLAILVVCGTAFLANASSARATTSVQTLPVNDVGALHAYLQGHLATNERGRLWFDFGTTTSYGTRLGEGWFQPDDITLTITAWVNPGTTYHFRFAAETIDPQGNVTGTYYGDDQSFQTPPAHAPSVGNLSVYVWDDLHGASISALVDTGALATSWLIEYGDDRSLGHTSDTHAIEPEEDVRYDFIAFGGITAGHPIYFQWVASNALQTVRSPLYYFLGSGDPVLAPPPPPPPFTGCAVPRVVGKKLARARSLLVRHRCRLGHVRRIASEHVRAGRVIKQSRKPGLHLPRGSVVGVTVSRG